MSKAILCADSGYDDNVQQIEKHRIDKLYPKLAGTIKRMPGPLSTRKYIKDELLNGEIGFFSASGHGNEDELIGNDQFPIFETGNYDAKEANGKIMHFLACSTAYSLGIDLIKKGCKAFFGYDVIFTYYKDHLDQFMAADDAIDLAIAGSKTAKEAHELAMTAYDKAIEILDQKNVNPAIIGAMMTNQRHLCTPMIDARWGDPAAKI
ncbi:MAG TPA: hypothetical protein VK541_14570 [Pedobacter sp.]|uniref:hypothetical protein n=1 Tax=Pedobacter sp. TaxID=1411316 RepID=UPI002BB8060B|nr:hypothetical protein [Pedobacter sp.]HMI03704.1 hypothetical protein [Pedobacter sp.]